MGVKGLWRLLLPIGRRISIETLEGKILAIDASIWLSQFLSVAAAAASKRDEDLPWDGPTTTSNATHRAYSYDYLVGFLRRMCKLRYQGIRPVFVFDGSTPEIKQRELQARRRRQKRKRESFLGGGIGDDDIDGEEGVRRLAKRILVQQLKATGGKAPIIVPSSTTNITAAANGSGDRTKSSMDNPAVGTVTTNASYASGFYDPESIAETETLVKPEEDKISSNNNVLNQSRDTEPAVRSSDDPEIIALLEDDEYLQDDTPEDGDNDWDAAINAHKDDDLLDSDEDDDNPAIDRKEKAKRFSKGKGGKKAIIPTGAFHAGDGTNFDVEAVASLAAIHRKDVVEDAQKNRRLQSRREFLKVASDPEGLSQCQLRNFLKSTKLNKDISSMAQRAAIQDEDEDEDEDGMTGHDKGKGCKSRRLGGVPSMHRCSRRARKVVFEKDSEKGKPTAKSKEAELQRYRQKKMSLLDTNNMTDSSHGDENDDDVDVDVNGEDGIGVAYHFSAARHHATDGNESSGSDDSIDDYTKKDQEGNNGGFLTLENGSSKHEATTTSSKTVRHASRSKNDRVTRRIRIQDESDSDEVDDKKLPAKDDATIAQELQDESLARALQQAEDDGDGIHDAMLDGGFLSTVGNKSGIEAIVPILDSDEDEKQTSDIENQDRQGYAELKIRVNQEREDEQLAARLQDIEFENEPAATFALSGPVQDEEKVRYASGTNESPTSKVDGASSLDESRETRVQRIVVVDDDGDEEDVDWEEGDDVSSKENGLIQNPVTDKDNKIGAAESVKSKFPLPIDRREESSSANEDEEEVNWEDASLDDDKDGEANNTPALTTNIAMNREPDDEIVEAESDEDPTTDFSRFHDDDWGQSNPSKEKSPDEVAQALAHAQATAANLTNWAGRAFRRAVAQHAEENGMEVPEIAKPKALRDTVHSSHDIQPTIVPNPKQETSSSQSFDSLNLQQQNEWNQTQSTDRTKLSTTAADNAKWFGELDTTSLASESFNQQQNLGREIGMDTSSGGVTEEMRTEVMELLRLFGVPYVVAPAEAEAQCVMLEKLKLVDGIVTEDSDAFVFGGQVIYKNIFDDQKYVEVYHSKDASEEMNLNRDAMVALAMLLGGDYTEGVKGVGIVNGMEILQAFDLAKDCKSGLTRFRQWLDGFDPLYLAKQMAKKTDGDDEYAALSKEEIFHKKHQSARTRWVAPKTFPDIKVLTAYLNPVVDTSKERFSWGVPDLTGLVEFCRKQMGWTPDETKKLVLPVIKQMEETTMRQTRIDSFMRYEDGIKFASIRSKRLREVLESASTSADRVQNERNGRRKGGHQQSNPQEHDQERTSTA